MNNELSEVQLFLLELHKQSQMEDLFPFPLIATAVAGEDTAIVIYRGSEGAPLVGKFYEYSALSALFDPNTPADVADAVIVNELVGPSGSGRVRNYPWERELTGLDEPVGWIHDPEKPLGTIEPFHP